MREGLNLVYNIGGNSRMEEPKTTGKVRFVEEPEILNKSDSRDDMLLYSPSIVKRPPVSSPIPPRQAQGSVSPAGNHSPYAPSSSYKKLNFNLEQLLQEDPEVTKLNEELEMLQAALEQKENEARASQEAREMEERRREEERQREREARERQRELVQQRIEAERELASQREEVQNDNGHINAEEIAPNQAHVSPVGKPAKPHNSRVTMAFDDWMRELQAQTHQASYQHKPSPFKSRQTIDINTLTALINNNFEDYQAYSERKERKPSSGRSNSFVERMSQGTPESPEQADLFKALEEAMDEETRARVIGELDQSIRVLREKKATMQQKVAWLDRLRNTPLMTEEQRSVIQKVKELTFEEYEEAMRPLKVFELEYNIRIHYFEIGSSVEEFKCGFTLDRDIFCKLRRHRDMGHAEIRMEYNFMLDIKPREWLFNVETRGGLIKNYMKETLCRRNGYDILTGLGSYYNRLLTLQSNLNSLVKVVDMEEIKIRGRDKAQFKLFLLQGCTVMVSLHLLRLNEPIYWELFHEEGGCELALDAHQLQSTDFVDVVRGLFAHLARPPS